MKKAIKTMIMATAILIMANGCKDETPTPANNNNGSGGSTTPEQYILMNGLKVSNKNPKPSTISVLQDDTSLTWIANTKSTILGDSFIRIEHPNGVKRSTNIVDDAATEYGEVYIAITYGQSTTATSVSLTEGDYKLEKVNGIWYSVLKNGKGTGTKGSTPVNYTGLEFRVAWPSTFK